jgi:hypothetical protein
MVDRFSYPSIEGMGYIANEKDSLDQYQITELQALIVRLNEICMGSTEGKIEFGYILLSTGNLNDEFYKLSKMRLLARQIESDKKQALDAKIQAEKFESEDAADSKYYVLFNRRNSDPNSLTTWSKRRQIAELESYLDQLKTRPQHYRCMFREGNITGAIEVLERLIEQKEMDKHVASRKSR